MEDEKVISIESTSKNDGISKDIILSKDSVASVKDANQFSSRWAFWLSAIGCSVGFGNLWRFPSLVFLHGGGAFFIPYFISIIFVALPVTFLEFGLGQLSQGANMASFRAIYSRSASVGWGFLGAFSVMNYYPLLLSWSLVYFANSFKTDLPWMFTQDEADMCSAISTTAACTEAASCTWNVATSNCNVDPLRAATDFFERSLSVSDTYNEGLTNINGYIFLAYFITIVLIFMGTVGGARILGYLNYFITIAPAVFLLLLVGVGCSLPGATKGLKEYIGKFDLSKLKSSTVWRDAVGQALYSMGACQGTMAAYSAHNKRTQNFVQDSYVVEAGDTLFAFIAGFATFAVLGYMSEANGIPIAQLPVIGRGLVFQAFPVGLGSGLGYPYAQICSVLFFMTLWLLGMSTSVGLVEGVCGVFIDSRLVSRNTKVRRYHIYGTACTILLLLGIMYSTNMGVHILGCTDFYVSSLGYVFIAVAECVSAGWFSAFDMYKERCGALAVYIHMGTFLGGTIMMAILGFRTPLSVGPILGPIIGCVIIVGGFCAALYKTKKQSSEGDEYSWRARVFHLTMYNVAKLRTLMNKEACADTIWRVPRSWLAVVKYFIPFLMTLLFFSVLTDPEQMFKNPISDEGVYPWWVFIFGFVGTFIMIVLVVAGFFAPHLMKFMLPAEEFEFTYHDKDIENRKGKIVQQVADFRTKSLSPNDTTQSDDSSP